MTKLRILHCLRAPVGGLFRHVRDLSASQAADGHQVGVIVDRMANDRLTEDRLDTLSAHLTLGLHRRTMSRDIGWRDFTATYATIAIAKQLECDVIHGHGAKGGAYARLAAFRLTANGVRVGSFYTPHGGSLHYAPASLKGRIFMALERRLARSTDGIIFESAYSADVYRRHVGPISCSSRVIENGLLPEEFSTHTPAPAATDIVFIGELRHLKGVDLLLEAMARIDRPAPVTATIVGDGPDAALFRQTTERLGLMSRVSFPGAMPAAHAFPLGRILVMPSRAESFPYIVLEAAAAGIPMIATSVGGIPEIVAGTDTKLVPSGNVAALAEAISTALDHPAEALENAARLKASVASRFTAGKMSSAIIAFYSETAR